MADAFGGSATVTTATLPAFGGTAEVVYDEPTDETVGGTATVDLTTWLAWSAAHRMTDVRVMLDGEDLSGLVGSVRVTMPEGGPALACEFELVDARNAALDPDSLAIGGRAVEVRVASRSRTGADERLVFVGTTESPANDEPYAPRASYRAIGVGNVWSETEVCTRVAAFSGLRRFAVLRDEAALLGMTLAVSDDGAELAKPWEFIGTKWWEFLSRQAELEDRYLRPEIDGSVTVLTWQDLQDQPSAATIRWSNSFPLREDPPQRPPTKIVLSGAQLTSDVLEETDRTIQVSVESEVFGRKSGRVWAVRIVGGVTVQTVDEEWETWALAGAVEGADGYRLRRRVTVDYTYPTVTLLNGQTRYTPALSGRVTEIEDYGAPETHEDDPLAVLWTDETYRTQSEETFALRQRITESFSYRPDDGSATACQLDTTEVKVEGYYAPLVAQRMHQDDGTETTQYRWADGSYRGREAFGTTREMVERWTDSADNDGPRIVTRRQDVTAYVEARPARGYRWPGTDVLTTITPSETYRYAGVISDTWTDSHIDGLGERVRSEANAETGEVSYLPSMESIPDIPRASALVPQYALDAFRVTWTLRDHSYPENVVTDLMEGAETAAEALTVARRRAGWALGNRWAIPLAMIPGLKPWQKVTLIDESRQTGAAGVEAYVLGYDLATDPTNGWLDQTLVIGTRREVA